MQRASERAYRFEWWIFLATALSLSLLVAFPRLFRSRTEGVLHPHGFCYIWDPVLVWSHVFGDALIGAAYLAISILLGLFVYRARHLLPFHWMFLAFGLFILTCGATHWMDIWTLWKPAFWASAALKIVTAVASVATALALPPLIPEALRLMKEASLSEQRREQLAVARRQRELMEAESRAKDLFLATLSHELRTPLNAISGWAQILHRMGADDPQVRKAVDAIQRNAAAQARLVEDMLDVSAIVTGRMQLERAPVEFAELVTHAVDAARPAAAAKSIDLRCEVTDKPLLLEGDAMRLQQAVGNLLSNALKFSEADGQIRVHLSRQDGQARLVIGDTGAGIDRAILPRIFDTFVQGDQTPTRARGGLGLGLAIVRHVVEHHGGTVAAESDGPGTGATFIVHVPLA